jgi:hypothetical protein
MSYTEIFGFGSDGKVKSSCDIGNSWRGAMAVWMILEKKYLPSLPKPDWARVCNEPDQYWSRTGSVSFDESKPHPMKPIWDLADDKRLSFGEQIVLCCTFDNVLIKRNDFKKVIDSFKEFEGETSLKEQAKAIELLLEDPDIQAVGFNQTSVNGDNWSNIGGYDKDDECLSYNFLTMDKHWWLFDELTKDKPKEGVTGEKDVS